MKKFIHLNNERGLTLLEVLLAMLILMIILVSIMNIFPQMGKINKTNENKLVTVNIMKEVLQTWKNDADVKAFLKSEDTGENLQKQLLENQNFANDNTKNYYEITGTDKTSGFDVEIRIAKQPDLDGVNKAHRIHIIFNDKTMKLSETYGYIIYENNDEGGNG